MKYNPPVNEKIAALPGLAYLHPYQPEEAIQGALEIMYNLGEDLCRDRGHGRLHAPAVSGRTGGNSPGF